MSEQHQVRTINNIGLGLLGLPGEHMEDFKVYEESGSVQIWVDVHGSSYLQYLTAKQAMAFAKAFERCAIAALKNES